jgi:septal ring factor EnvC (AmiA/AmiB activator)
MKRLAAALAVPALLLAAASPAPTANDLDAARRARQAALDAARAASEQAKAMDAESDRLAQARVAAASGLRATEDQIADLAERIVALQAERDAAAASARQRAALLDPLLPLAERLSLYPAETLLSVPAPPEQAIRGVLVLQGLAREVRDAVAALAAERALAAATADELEAARQLQSGLAARQRAQAESLDQQIADAQKHRSEAQIAATAAAGRAAAMAARAETLRAAIAAIEATRKAEAARTPPTAPAPTQPNESAGLAGPASGGWTAPVAGRPIRRFGAATEAGPASGITFAAPVGARVVAPCAGRIVFAGPFRSYGQLLIVQCGAGLHAVLAGLGRLDVPVGQAVRTGEPVGIMGDGGGPDTAGGGSAALYVEIRRSGVAVDPAQYLRQKG